MEKITQKFDGDEKATSYQLNNQICGGTLYAVDRINLQIRAKSHLTLHFLRIVKDGNRNYKKIKIDSRNLDCSINEEVGKDTYYRVEIDFPEDYQQVESKSISLTNPIFVKKIKGPQKGYFYFQNNAPFFFSQEKGRFVANLTQLKDIKFHNDIWEITFFDEGEGKIFIGAKIKGIELDGERVEYKREKGEIVVPFLKGTHKMKIKL